MILLLVLLVVLVAMAAAGLLGVGVLSGDRRGERTGLLALLSAPVVLGVGVLVLAALLFGVGGRSVDDDTVSPPPVPKPTSGPAPTTDLPFARVEAGGAGLPVVRITPSDEDRFSAYEPVSGLAPGAVVRVLAEGFDWHEEGRVEQCVVELGHQTACAEAFPVQFDGDGRADFQFGVRGDIAPGGCRPGQATCLLRLTGGSGHRGTVQTVLGDRLVRGDVRVDPSRSVVDGQPVAVSVTGFPPGATATAVLCAPPDVYDARRCSSPDPASTFTVDAQGGGRTTLVVAAGRLGVDRALCGPRRPCGVTVLVGPGFLVAPATPVSFSAGPGVDYEGARLLTGLAIGAFLVAVAFGLARRTDWTKPTEAATPEMDRADLQTDQDLDEIFGTDEEIDARYPIG